jgi:hypothetical protein
MGVPALEWLKLSSDFRSECLHVAVCTQLTFWAKMSANAVLITVQLTPVLAGYACANAEKERAGL